MKILVFANRMPDLCGAFLHDVDLAIELQKRGHQVVFMIVQVPKEGYNGGYFRGFRYMHYTAGSSFLDSSQLWICPHSPCLPAVRKINSRGYNRPIVATCHFDGNYEKLTKEFSTKWVEMLMFINSIMEPNYRANIKPWPSSIVRTEVVRPLMHKENILIQEEFQGDCITLVNANLNKGVLQFLELARRLPSRKFLGVLPYYGELQVPPAPDNVEWIPFSDDIRDVLKRTRVLLLPSYYESFGRIAVEALLNGIPVLYSRPAKKPKYPGGSTEGVKSWIGDAGIDCDRDVPEEWISAIQSLDDEETYKARAQLGKEHIDSMNLFSEATRIAELIESFGREHPVVTRQEAPAARSGPQEIARPRQPVEPGRVGFGFSNGRLKIQR